MNLENTKIVSIDKIISPKELKTLLSPNEETKNNIIKWRADIENIIKGVDNRLIVVIGPCSIHDPIGALDYASRLKVLHEVFQDKLFIIMRVYFEKPRTTVGWKGLINDPNLDGSFDEIDIHNHYRMNVE